MTIGDRIKKIRNKMSMSQVDFADKINVSKQTLYKYENNIITNIPSDKIELIAEVGHTTPSYLMGWVDDPDAKVIPIETTRVPVYGYVAAGQPILCDENIVDYIEIPADLARSGEYFCVKIRGESMEPRILEGDVVIVHKQSNAESGDIVIAQVNGDEATCKRLKKYFDHIELHSNNPHYGPMNYSAEEVENLPVRILGRCTEVRGHL